LNSKIKLKKSIKPINELGGLNQFFSDKKGKKIQLKKFLIEEDWWQLKSRTRIAYIVSHDAVKKIADKAGVLTNPEYTVLIQPEMKNDYTLAFQCRVTDSKGRQSTEIGESSRNNLGNHGRNNPVNMAQKRAFDRAVFKHLGITGLLGEDELPDEEPDKEMDKLTHEEKQKIAPLINEIWMSKDKNSLTIFQKKMVKVSKEYTEGQLDILRGLYRKKLTELQKSF
jgi:hypothetical protein